MNYAQAHQRMDENGDPSGLWDWTTENNLIVRRSAPCTSNCAHRSEDEATRHWYDYSLTFAQRFEHPDTQTRCTVCGDWTITRLAVTQMWLYGFTAELCWAHLGGENLKDLFPFKGATQLIYS